MGIDTAERLLGLPQPSGEFAAALGEPGCTGGGPELGLGAAIASFKQGWTATGGEWMLWVDASGTSGLTRACVTQCGRPALQPYAVDEVTT